jgi:hypothetical protein
MKKPLVLIASLVSALLLASSCARVFDPDYDVTFVGQVRLSDGKEPSGVAVKVEGEGGKSTTTNSDGSFILEGKVVDNAVITLEFIKSGYQTARRKEVVGEIKVGSGDEEKTQIRAGQINVGTITLQLL